MYNRCEECIDECGCVSKNYYWVQGDTFENAIKVIDKEGNLVTNETLDNIEFRLLDGNKDIEYFQNYEYNAEKERWEISIPALETAKWEIETHYYRYVATYKGGVTKTLRTALFVVEK